MVSSTNNKLENSAEFTNVAQNLPESDNLFSSENKETLKVLKKMTTQDKKQEINLPKGRILLFKTAKEYAKKENEYLPTVNINKSYSKKWLDDISDNCISPMQLLKDNFDEDVGCLLDDSNINAVKLGKSTNDLVNSLWNKTGKDRYMQKVPYMEYMPHETKPATPSFNRACSRMTSAFSFAQDDGLVSDDYTERPDSRTKSYSRLSGQPVLCTRQLISRLSCKNDIEDIESDVPDLKLDELNVFTNYKDTFLLEELSKRSSISSSTTSSTSMQNDEQDAMIKIHIDTSSFEKSKKILKKRTNIENNKIETFQESKQVLASSLNETKHTNSEEDLTQEENIPIHIEIKDEKRGDDYRAESVPSENLPNLKSYRSLNSSLQNRCQQRLLFSRYSQNASTENSNTNIIRIRRVFDGETLKINQMNLNPSEARSDHLKHDRNVKSATAASSHSKPKRLIKSAEHRTIENKNLKTEELIDIVESLVLSTNTKKSSNTINDIKQDNKRLLTQRNSINTIQSKVSNVDNTRKTKSAGSKVRFNESLTQPINLMNLMQKRVEDELIEKIEKVDSSNLITESIVESKIIDLKETSHEYNEMQDEYQQKSISQNSFTEEIKSEPLTREESQEREEFTNEDQDGIINDVISANLEKSTEINVEIKTRTFEVNEILSDEVEETYQEGVKEQEQIEKVESLEIENKDNEKEEIYESNDKPEKPLEPQTDLNYQFREALNEKKDMQTVFDEEKNKIEIFLQKADLIDQESSTSKEFMHDLNDQSTTTTNEYILGIVDENEDEKGDLITEYLKKPSKRVEISNIVVERTISDSFFVESKAKLVDLDIANNFDSLEDRREEKYDDYEEEVKHEITIIKPATTVDEEKQIPTSTSSEPNFEPREMPRIITKLPSTKHGKKGKKSKKHKVQAHFNEVVLDDEQMEILKEKKRQLLLKIEQMKAQLDPKHVYPKYTYLQIPYQYQDPIVDHAEFTKAFHLPEKICPQIHKIDPRTTSIEQLDLEKRIMEERIRDLFIKKTSAFNAGILIGNDIKKKTQKKKLKAKDTKSDELAAKKEKKTKDTKESKASRERRESLAVNDILFGIKSETEIRRRDTIVEEEETDEAVKNQERERLESIKETEQIKEIKELKENKDQKLVKTPKDAKEVKDHKEQKDSKETQVKEKKVKETAPKNKLNQDERMRLYNEALNKQIERDNIYNMIIKNISDKEEEIEQLNEELEKNNNEFETRLQSISQQIKEIDAEKNQVINLMNKSKSEYLEKLNIKFENERKYQRIRFEEIKEERLKELEFKIKECEFIASIYNDEADKLKAIRRIDDLEDGYQKWLSNFDVRIAREEHELDDRLNDEEDMFINLQHDEEDNAVRPFYEENLRLLNEKNELVENFEDIKLKIVTRNQTLKEEIESLKAEKLLIEETTEKNIQLQTAKLNELLKIEKEAKDKIKNELENYRLGIMKIREKNLKMKYDLSMLKHSHGITKPHVFSYYSEFPNYEKTEISNNSNAPVPAPTTNTSATKK